MNTEQLTQLIEDIFPPMFQEEWDNSGWNLNLHPPQALPILICVDVTAAVVQRAAQLGCRVIVSHHPLYFRRMRSIDSDTHTGHLTRLLIENGISVYSAHTSADNSPRGINMGLARTLGLADPRVLSASGVPLYKLAVTVPPENADAVREALFEAGCGKLGGYSRCAFTASGEGTFCGASASNPYIGRPGESVEVLESRIEVLCSAQSLAGAEKAARAAHPYEMPAIDIYRLERSNPDVGSGAVGVLQNSMSLCEFAQFVKEKLEVGTVRMHGDPASRIRTVALCGGAGGDFIEDAERAGADVFVSGELKHNMFCEHDIPLLEVGHYASERIFEQLLLDALQKHDSVLESEKDIFLSEGLESPYIDI